MVWEKRAEYGTEDYIFQYYAAFCIISNLFLNFMWSWQIVKQAIRILQKGAAADNSHRGADTETKKVKSNWLGSEAGDEEDSKQVEMNKILDS